MFWSKRAAIEVTLFPESPSGTPMREICSPRHRNSIGKSTARYKRVIRTVGRVLHPTWANRADLYFLLMYLRRDSHRFFIFLNLTRPLH